MGLSIRSDIIHHIQSISSNTWTIVHNLNTLTPVIDCWIDSGGSKTKILPLVVTSTDANTCTITFSSPQIGEAVVV